MDRFDSYLLPMHALRTFAGMLALATALLLWAEDADARLKYGLNFAGPGSRVSLSQHADASPTRVAAATDHIGAVQPPYPGGSLGGLFNRPGIMGGFAAGFLGAGLLGLVFGHGMLAGLNGPASLVGLAFQLILVAMLMRLIWSWWSGGNVANFSGLSPRQLADPYLRSRHEAHPGIDLPAGADDLGRGGKHAP